MITWKIIHLLQFKLLRDDPGGSNAPCRLAATLGVGGVGCGSSVGGLLGVGSDEAEAGSASSHPTYPDPWAPVCLWDGLNLWLANRCDQEGLCGKVKGNPNGSSGWIPNWLDCWCWIKYNRHLRLLADCEKWPESERGMRVMRQLLALHLWPLLATTSMAMVTSMATMATTVATSLAMVDLVGAKSSPWDWQKGTGEYAK